MRYAILFLHDADMNWDMYFNQLKSEMSYTGLAVVKDFVDRDHTSRLVHVVLESSKDKEYIKKEFEEFSRSCRIGMNTPSIKLLFPDDRLWDKKWDRVKIIIEE